MPIIDFLLSHRNKYRINRGDIVIDIGSGNSPFFRSDILVEKYIQDDSERYSGIVLDRTTVCADGNLLPFRDKSIDFIYCSQVLEHIPEPHLFLDEMSRIGKRGLIVTPHPGYDMIHPRRGHLWYVENRKGSLHLKQKTRWDEYPEIYNYFREITYLPGYWEFWNKHYGKFNTIFEWNEKISYKIDRHGDFDMSRFIRSAVKTESEIIIESKHISIEQKAKSFISRFLHPIISDHTHIDINNLICCPLCKGSLTHITPRTLNITCQSCRAIFKVRNSIPYLLAEDGTTPQA